MVEHFRLWNNGDHYDKSLPISSQCPIEFFSFYNNDSYSLDINTTYNSSTSNVETKKSDNTNVILQGSRFLARYILPSIHNIAANALKLTTNEFDKLFQAAPQICSLRLNYYLPLNGKYVHI